MPTYPATPCICYVTTTYHTPPPYETIYGHTGASTASKTTTYFTATQTPTSYLAIADTGTTGHFIQPNALPTMTTPSHIPIYVKLPDGNTITSTQDANIAWQHLPPSAT